MKILYLKILVGSTILLFCFFLFKNISYPLLWNDEQETAMFAERIWQYGYPKADDGRNVVDMMGYPSRYMIEEDSGAYIGTTWGRFYFGVIGAYLASFVDDFYWKTALVRIPFALIGLLGLGLLVYTASLLLPTGSNRLKLILMAAFFAWETVSVPLILHFRDARAYPILMLLLAGLFWFYVKYRILPYNGKYRGYIAGLFILQLLIFNLFTPAYFSLLVSMSLFECLDFVWALGHRRPLPFVAVNATATAFFLSLVPVSFEMGYYKALDIAKEAAQYFKADLKMYLSNLESISIYFNGYELVFFALLVKFLALFLFVFYQWKLRRVAEGKEVERNLAVSLALLMRFSWFLCNILIIYILSMAKFPIPCIFVRYYIVMQPVLTIIMLLDLSVIYLLLRNGKLLANVWKLVVVVMLVGMLGWNSWVRKWQVNDYIYEMFHQYKGPLDYVIPYIKENFKNSEELVIATNYEEGAYMYYLKSQAIVGYMGARLKEHASLYPDIIVFRKRGAFVHPSVFQSFLDRGRYKRVYFPVVDYLVNNIPDVGVCVVSHKFRTMPSNDWRTQLEIFVRADKEY
ncbi:MAG: hypothetical protein IT292_07305 [Deltaproteobacteria bacterium]|nr:hypothetical protein [Deltaproteobacteria bacterium]